MPIPWRNYSVRDHPFSGRTGAQIAGSFARRLDSRVKKICMRIRPRFRATSMIPRPTVSFLHFSSPTRSASPYSHPLVGRSSTPVGKFSSTLFINTDHLSRIARGSSSSLPTNNRLVKLLRERLSRLCEVDHHRLSCHESV